ncbi:MAG TPA: glycosyltransferase family 2 protein [Thermoleophilaceae bacterium]|nr:glycosyltransferase family 2 protein [Thermoleophilaceae bacterium]
MLDVVIVSASGGRAHLRSCLRSLERHPPRSGAMTVHVVDNASRDGTVEMVRREFPTVALAELGRNLGFAVANNGVLRRSTEPFALLLNPDTEVLEGTLDRSLEVMRERPRVGVLGCRLTLPDGSFDVHAKWSFPTPLGALGHFTGVGLRPRSAKRLSQYRAPAMPEGGAGEVDAVGGAFMLARREAMAEVGLLDEGYRLYIEDLDWCYRFKERGWKVWSEGRVEALHAKGATTLEDGRHRTFYADVGFHRGMGRFYRKFYAGRRPALDALVYAAIGGKLALSVTRAAAARHGSSG